MLIKNIKLNDGRIISQQVSKMKDFAWNITYDKVDEYGNVIASCGCIYVTQFELWRQIPEKCSYERKLLKGVNEPEKCSYERKLLKGVNEDEN